MGGADPLAEAAHRQARREGRAQRLRRRDRRRRIHAIAPRACDASDRRSLRSELQRDLSRRREWLWPRAHRERGEGDDARWRDLGRPSQGRGERVTRYRNLWGGETAGTHLQQGCTLFRYAHGREAGVPGVETLTLAAA